MKPCHPDQDQNYMSGGGTFNAYFTAMREEGLHGVKVWVGLSGA